MNMALSTILPAICGWGDTCSVLVLHGIGSQYLPLIPEARGGSQYSPPAFAHVKKPETPISHSTWMLFRSAALQFIIQNSSSTNSRFLASMRHVSYCWWIASLCTLVAMLFVFLCAFETWFRVGRCHTIPLCILHWYHHHGTRYWYL